MGYDADRNEILISYYNFENKKSPTPLLCTVRSEAQIQQPAIGRHVPIVPQERNGRHGKL